MEVKVCEEVKKECISMRFHDISYLYFPPNYLRIVSDCIKEFCYEKKIHGGRAYRVFPLK